MNDGEQPVRAVQRARILLMADDGATDHRIVDVLDCGESTPYHVRKRYADRGIDGIHRKLPDRTQEGILDWEAEARLIAVACSDPPVGQALELLTRSQSADDSTGCHLSRSDEYSRTGI